MNISQELESPETGTRASQRRHAGFHCSGCSMVFKIKDDLIEHRTSCSDVKTLKKVKKEPVLPSKLQSHKKMGTEQKLFMTSTLNDALTRNPNESPQNCTSGGFLSEKTSFWDTTDIDPLEKLRNELVEKGNPSPVQSSTSRKSRSVTVKHPIKNTRVQPRQNQPRKQMEETKNDATKKTIEISKESKIDFSPEDPTCASKRRGRKSTSPSKQGKSHVSSDGQPTEINIETVVDTSKNVPKKSESSPPAKIWPQCEQATQSFKSSQVESEVKQNDSVVAEKNPHAATKIAAAAHLGVTAKKFSLDLKGARKRKSDHQTRKPPKKIFVADAVNDANDANEIGSSCDKEQVSDLEKIRMLATDAGRNEKQLELDSMEKPDTNSQKQQQKVQDTDSNQEEMSPPSFRNETNDMDIDLEKKDAPESPLVSDLETIETLKSGLRSQRKRLKSESENKQTSGSDLKNRNKQLIDSDVKQVSNVGEKKQLQLDSEKDETKFSENRYNTRRTSDMGLQSKKTLLGLNSGEKPTPTAPDYDTTSQKNRTPNTRLEKKQTSDFGLISQEQDSELVSEKSSSCLDEDFQKNPRELDVEKEQTSDLDTKSERKRTTSLGLRSQKKMQEEKSTSSPSLRIQKKVPELNSSMNQSPNSEFEKKQTSDFGLSSHEQDSESVSEKSASRLDLSQKILREFDLEKEQTSDLDTKNETKQTPSLGLRSQKKMQVEKSTSSPGLKSPKKMQAEKSTSSPGLRSQNKMPELNSSMNQTPNSGTKSEIQQTPNSEVGKSEITELDTRCQQMFSESNAEKTIEPDINIESRTKKASSTEIDKMQTPNMGSRRRKKLLEIDSEKKQAPDSGAKIETKQTPISEVGKEQSTDRGTRSRKKFSVLDSEVKGVMEQKEKSVSKDMGEQVQTHYSEMVQASQTGSETPQKPKVESDSERIQILDIGSRSQRKRQNLDVERKQILNSDSQSQTQKKQMMNSDLGDLKKRQVPDSPKEKRQTLDSSLQSQNEHSEKRNTCDSDDHKDEVSASDLEREKTSELDSNTSETVSHVDSEIRATPDSHSKRQRKKVIDSDSVNVQTSDFGLRSRRKHEPMGSMEGQVDPDSKSHINQRPSSESKIQQCSDSKIQCKSTLDLNLEKKEKSDLDTRSSKSNPDLDLKKKRASNSISKGPRKHVGSPDLEMQQTSNSDLQIHHGKNISDQNLINIHKEKGLNSEKQHLDSRICFEKKASITDSQNKVEIDMDAEAIQSSELDLRINRKTITDSVSKPVAAYNTRSPKKRILPTETTAVGKPISGYAEETKDSNSTALSGSVDEIDSSSTKPSHPEINMQAGIPKARDPQLKVSKLSSQKQAHQLPTETGPTNIPSSLRYTINYAEPELSESVEVVTTETPEFSLNLSMTSTNKSPQKRSHGMYDCEETACPVVDVIEEVVCVTGVYEQRQKLEQYKYPEHKKKTEKTKSPRKRKLPSSSSVFSLCLAAELASRDREETEMAAKSLMDIGMKDPSAIVEEDGVKMVSILKSNWKIEAPAAPAVPEVVLVEPESTVIATTEEKPQELGGLKNIKSGINFLQSLNNKITKRSSIDDAVTDKSVTPATTTSMFRKRVLFTAERKPKADDSNNVKTESVVPPPRVVREIQNSSGGLESVGSIQTNANSKAVEKVKNKLGNKMPATDKNAVKEEQRDSNEKISKDFKFFVCGLCSQGFHDCDALKEHIDGHRSSIDSVTIKPDITDDSVEPDLEIIESYKMEKQEASSDISDEALDEGNYVSDVSDDVERNDVITKLEGKDLVEMKDGVSDLFSCGHCEKDFGSELKLSRHMSTSHLCSVCNAEFSQKTKLRKHFISAHQDFRPFSCSLCDKRFSFRYSLKEHMKTHKEVEEGVEHLCKDCGKAFQRVSSLRKHMKEYHSKLLSHVCGVCGKGFAFMCGLKLHLLTHGNERRYHCEHCDMRFKHASNLQKHVKVIHMRKCYCPTITCVCGMRDSSVKLDHACKVCGRICLSAKHLEVHMRSHTGAKPEICEECGKAFQHKSNLQKHQLKHTGVRPYTCLRCGRSFFAKHTFLGHMRLHSGDTPYTCDTCGKKFISKNGLQVHMILHGDTKPYRCGECGKEFAQCGNLNKHLAIHTGERPFMCSHCDKRFVDTSALKRHIVIHTRERKFSCPTCNKTFLHVSSLRSHVLTHSGNRPHVCTVCNKAFTQRANYARHMKVHDKVESEEVVLNPGEYIVYLT